MDLYRDFWDTSGKMYRKSVRRTYDPQNAIISCASLSFFWYGFELDELDEALTSAQGKEVKKWYYPFAESVINQASNTGSGRIVSNIIKYSEMLLIWWTYKKARVGGTVYTNEWDLIERYTKYARLRQLVETDEKADLEMFIAVKNAINTFGTSGVNPKIAEKREFWSEVLEACKPYVKVKELSIDNTQAFTTVIETLADGTKIYERDECYLPTSWQTTYHTNIRTFFTYANYPRNKPALPYPSLPTIKTGDSSKYVSVDKNFLRLVFDEMYSMSYKSLFLLAISTGLRIGDIYSNLVLHETGLRFMKYPEDGLNFRYYIPVIHPEKGKNINIVIQYIFLTTECANYLKLLFGVDDLINITTKTQWVNAFQLQPKGNKGKSPKIREVPEILFAELEEKAKKKILQESITEEENPQEPELEEPITEEHETQLEQEEEQEEKETKKEEVWIEEIAKPLNLVTPESFRQVISKAKFKVLTKLRKSTRLRFTPHSLRAYFQHASVASGVDSTFVETMLGHILAGAMESYAGRINTQEKYIFMIEKQEVALSITTDIVDRTLQSLQKFSEKIDRLEVKVENNEEKIKSMKDRLKKLLPRFAELEEESTPKVVESQSLPLSKESVT